MIRIDRSRATTPAILRTGSGKRATDALIADYDGGVRSFEFNSDIYGAKSVKNALIRLQDGKCCFCESQVTHISYGDVEHFRPKGGWAQDRNDAMTQPGYYWLAYDWSNLLLSCQLCNQRYKKNLFPLVDPAQRAKSHADGIDEEDAIFINPSTEDPEALIGWRMEIPYAIGDNERADASITELGLDRGELEDRRRSNLRKTREILLTIQMAEAVADQLPETMQAQIESLREVVREALLPTSEYVAMTRASVREICPSLLTAS